MGDRKVTHFLLGQRFCLMHGVCPKLGPDLLAFHGQKPRRKLPVKSAYDANLTPQRKAVSAHG
jgi:hypothetical protein